jgi:shikimate kinase
MNIILTGYMGSGKTEIGARLSQKLYMKYIDLDQFIEEKEGFSVTDLFEKKGNIYFRKVESKYLNEIIKKDNFIISLGGGTPCYHENHKIFNVDNNISFYLKHSRKNLSERLFAIKKNRPLISKFESKEKLLEFISKHLFEREFYYSKAKNTITCDDKSIDVIINQIIEILE